MLLTSLKSLFLALGSVGISSPRVCISCSNNAIKPWTAAFIFGRALCISERGNKHITFYISFYCVNRLLFSLKSFSYLYPSHPWGICDGITMLGSNFRLYQEATDRLDISCITVPQINCRLSNRYETIRGIFYLTAEGYSCIHASWAVWNLINSN